jgi:hypothetical protein
MLCNRGISYLQDEARQHPSQFLFQCHQLFSGKVNHLAQQISTGASQQVTAGSSHRRSPVVPFSRIAKIRWRTRWSGLKRRHNAGSNADYHLTPLLLRSVRRTLARQPCPNSSKRLLQQAASQHFRRLTLLVWPNSLACEPGINAFV